MELRANLSGCQAKIPSASPAQIRSTLTKIESDVVVKPSMQTVAKIAKALEVPIEKLL